MATYSDSTFNAAHYENARPTYPQSLYDALIAYHEGEKEVAVDIGTGSGFVAFKLAEYFKSVIGTDPSSTMIQKCNGDPRTISVNIKFVEAFAEKLPFADRSVDMITGAECCHWFDHPKFFQESARVLKPHGTLAYWFYKDPIFIGHPKANEIYRNYCWNSSIEANPNDEFEKWMGPYYEQPGHNYLGTLMKEVEVPSDLFYDVERHEYLVDNSGHPIGEKESPLMIKKTVTLSQFLEYVQSWSAYHSWMKDHGSKYDIAEKFVEELKSIMGWDDTTRVDVVWDTMYTFARRRE